MTKSKQNSLIGFIITTSILGALLALFVVLYAISASNNNANSLALEQIYQKNFYDLVENVNNTENKLAKTIASTDKNYQAKLLKEVSKNSNLAQISLNNLPYSINGIEESVAFINQVSGYTETLAHNIENGETLSNKDVNTLEKIYDSILTMKNSLGKMSETMWSGYNILNASIEIDGDQNSFTTQISNIKNVDVEFPTMIYDGPFSDTMVRKEVKGLKDNIVEEATAKQNLLKIFSTLTEENVEYKNDTLGRFETYNYIVKNNDKEKGYIQMTKQGGKLLTLTSYTDKQESNLTIENAKSIAVEFAQKNGIENPEVVWSDILQDNAYINIAPVINNIIYYPDLVKIKIDLYNGDILGYEATSYYTNHTTRSLISQRISKSTAQNKIPSKFNIKFGRLALIPVDYNQEVLTYEFSCTLGNDEYYFYFDVENANEINILKVLKTNNGNLLM